MSVKFSNQPFFDAPTDTGGGKELTHEEMIKFMGMEDGEKLDLKEDEKEGEKEGEEGKEGEDLEKELEEELEEPDEEKLELMTPVRRKEILAKFPTLFKEFPYLERAYYREQQFTELLPTIDDAKLAVEKSTTLDNFEKDLLGGNTERILQAVKQHDVNAFNKIVDGYLDTLGKVDQGAYYHVLGNVVKNTITAMVNEARKSNNETLQAAAVVLNQFVFGTSDFSSPTKLAAEEKKEGGEEERIKERERAFTQRQYESARDDLTTRVDNILKATIEGNIDPRESMTPYVKRTAAREALEDLSSLIDQDSRFSTILDRLWEKAFEDNFTKVSLDRIRSAYLSKAKTLLPSVIKKARNEALKGLGKRVREESEKEEESPREKKGLLPVGKSTSSSSSGKTNKEQAQQIPRGMKSIDFLNQE